MIWKASFQPSTLKASKNPPMRWLLVRARSARDEDEEQAHDERVDPDRLCERDAEDVRHEDRAGCLGIATERLHRLADGDAETDARADGPEPHRETGGEIGVHFFRSSFAGACR